LFISGEKKLGTDEETFVILLGHAGRQQLLAVFEEYKAISGITLEQAVKSEFSGDLHKAILTISKSFLFIFWKVSHFKQFISKL